MPRLGYARGHSAPVASGRVDAPSDLGVIHLPFQRTPGYPAMSPERFLSERDSGRTGHVQRSCNLLNTSYAQQCMALLNTHFRRHSTVAHAAWHDLLRSLQDEAVGDLRGTPTRVERNGRVYWYDSYRIGSDVRKAYVGEDSEELRARFARVAELRTRRDETRRERARLIRIL